MSQFHNAMIIGPTNCGMTEVSDKYAQSAMTIKYERNPANLFVHLYRPVSGKSKLDYKLL